MLIVLKSEIVGAGRPCATHRLDDVAESVPTGDDTSRRPSCLRVMRGMHDWKRNIIRLCAARDVHVAGRRENFLHSRLYRSDMQATSAQLRHALPRLPRHSIHSVLYRSTAVSSAQGRRAVLHHAWVGTAGRCRAGCLPASLSLTAHCQQRAACVRSMRIKACCSKHEPEGRGCARRHTGAISKSEWGATVGNCHSLATLLFRASHEHSDSF